MKCDAVFVDGTGHIREMMVERELSVYRFPIAQPYSLMANDSPPAPIDFPVAEFVRIGRLPDNRVVYGQTEARLKLWRLDIDVTDEAQMNTQVDIATYQRDEWLRECGRPALCLFHSVRRKDGLILTHHFEGVGREVS